MTTKPTVPPAAAEAALCAFERGAGYSHRERVRWGLVAALPHLLPGMFVAPDGGDCLTIWAQGDDLTHPVEQMVRTQANAPLFDAVAALLPDRTDEAEAS